MKTKLMRRLEQEDNDSEDCENSFGDINSEGEIEDDDEDEYCSSKQDLLDAIAVAEKIGVDIEVVNFAKEYKEKVVKI